MKIKLLVWLGEKILGKAFSDEEPRADMYLPIWLLAFSMLLMVGGAVAGVYALIWMLPPTEETLIIAAVAVGAILLGVLALLCWKNQTITMLPNDAFEYSTFLGNKKVYHFDQIKGLRKNNDSMTLFLDGGKVHLESTAIISDRLVERITRQLEVIYSEVQ